MGTVDIRAEINAFAIGAMSLGGPEVYPIADSAAPLWDVTNAVSDSQLAYWDVTNAIADSAAPLWDVTNGIADSMVPLWDVRHELADAMLPLWDVTNVFADSLVASWDVAQSNDFQFSVYWQIDTGSRAQVAALSPSTQRATLVRKQPSF